MMQSRAMIGTAGRPGGGVPVVLPAAPGTANGEPAGTRLVAEAVALARLLPDLRESGRAGARAAERLGGQELARLRADAQVMAQVAGTGAVTAAQRRAADDVRTALATVPHGALPEEMAGHAVAAAGAVARLRVFAEALSGPEHAAAFATHSSRQAEPLDEDAWSWARNAAVVRAAISTLERRREELDPAVAAFAARLGAGDETTADARLRDRLAAIAAARVRRAGELTRRLRAKLRPAGPCAIHAADPARLSWLRQVLKCPLYTPEFEARVAPWLGTDPFGLRVPPPAPEFLSGVDVTAVPAEQVAPLLRRISLTRQAPTAGELTPDALAAQPGDVSAAVRPPETRAWGQAPDSGAPLLPERTEIPRLVHGIWLGSPMPATTSFWDNYGRGARRYAGRADFVFWTDVPRARFDAARATPVRDGLPDPYAYERKLLDWATSNDIVLVNFLELFHSGAPMRTYPLYVLEMAKQLPRGYAAASDHLRVEIAYRFGGAYVDGDNAFVPDTGATTADLPHFLDQVAASAFGFTLNPKPGLGVGNDIIVGPARHPVFDVWLECARLNYFRTTADIFGGKPEMAGKFVGEQRQAHRYVTAHRTGRVHHRVLGLLGIDSSALPLTDTVVTTASELTWVPPRTGEPAGRGDAAGEEVPRVLACCVTFLQWQLIARTGDLYLAAVEPVLRRLPDPDAAWTAVLCVLTALSELDGTPAIASVTDLRRGDDHRLSTVELPPEAEALLDRSARPAGWLGAGLGAAGEPVWLLDERVSPAAYRGPAGVVAHPLAPFAEVAVDPLGTPVGLRLCVKGTVADRFGGRFAGLAPHELGVRIVEDGDGRLSVPAASVAGLLAELGAAHRPVVVLTGGWAPAEPFVARLAALLDRPVRHRASEDTTSAEPPVEYLSFAAYLRRRDSAGR